MAFRVKIKESALKALKKIDKTARARIWTAISELAENPRPPGCVKMAGTDDLWRIRVGGWRVVFQIRNEGMVVFIIRVGHRREIYRKQ